MLALTLMILPWTTDYPTPSLDEWQGMLDAAMISISQVAPYCGAAAAVVTPEGTRYRGFGYADVAQTEPIDPKRHLFRVGSVSKLLAWITLVQLADEGKLALEDSVNNYLPEDLQLETLEGVDVRIVDLMNHTAGFEDQYEGLLVRTPEEKLSVENYIRRYRPKQVRRPGWVTSYSNYGANLAGYVIERATGQRLEDVFRERLLVPLQMTQSTVEQPVPAALKPNLVQGTAFWRGSYQEVPEEICHTAAACGLSASMPDMVRWMQALLSDDGSPFSFKRFRTPTFQYPGWDAGMRHGFLDHFTHPTLATGYSGDTLAFHSTMMLYPELDVGIVIATNTGVSSRPIDIVLTTLHQSLLDFWGEQRPPEPAAQIDVSELVGSYVALRRIETKMLRIAALGGIVDVEATGTPGELNIRIPLVQGWRRYVAVSETRFRSIESAHEVIFFKDPETGESYLSPMHYHVIGFQKGTGWDHPWFQFILTIVLASLWLILGVAAAWRWVGVRRLGDDLPARWNPNRSRWRQKHRLVRLGLATLFMAMIGSFVAGVLPNPFELAFGHNGWIILAEVLGWIVAGALALWCVWLGIDLWRRWHHVRLMREGVGTLTMVGFAVLTLAWMIEWRWI